MCKVEEFVGGGPRSAASLWMVLRESLSPEVPAHTSALSSDGRWFSVHTVFSSLQSVSHFIIVRTF